MSHSMSVSKYEADLIVNTVSRMSSLLLLLYKINVITKYRVG